MAEGRDKGSVSGRDIFFLLSSIFADASLYTSSFFNFKIPPMEGETRGLVMGKS